MAFDAFIKVDSLEGESSDAQFKGWVEPSSFTFGAMHSGSPSSSSAGAPLSGRVSFSDFTITKLVDKLSGVFNKYMIAGQHFPEVKMVLCRAGSGVKTPYYEFTMKHVYVSSSSVGGHAAASSLPMETVSFTPGEVVMKYTATDVATGASGGTVPAGWSQITNAEVAG
jgi:type VI secretion system Hcp family effector